jgi:hypothetical protein
MTSRPLAVSTRIAEVWFDIARGESTGMLTGSRHGGDDLDRAAEAVTGTIIMLLRLAVSPRLLKFGSIASAEMIRLTSEPPTRSQSVLSPRRPARANSVGVIPVFALKRRVKWLCSE